MATRTDARRAVIGILFGIDSGNPGFVKYQERFFEEQKIKNKQKEFAQQLLDGALKHWDEIDTLIRETLRTWKIEELGKVDKALLRLGAYEIVYTKTDIAIIINEAIEIAKIIGEDDTPKFVNGILNAIKEHRKP